MGQKPLTVAWRELGGNGVNGHLEDESAHYLEMLLAPGLTKSCNLS